MNKKCSKCGEEKDISFFFKAKNTKDGLYPSCKECKSKKRKEWKEKNKKKVFDYNSIYNKSDKKKISDKKYREKRKKKYKEDIYYKSMVLIYSSFKRHIKKKDKYKFIDFNEIFKHLKSTIPEGYNIEDWEKGFLHIDHIIPQSLYDFTNEEDIKKCWNKKNLRLIPAEENIKKGNELNEDLVKEHGIYNLLP